MVAPNFHGETFCPTKARVSAGLAPVMPEACPLCLGMNTTHEHETPPLVPLATMARRLRIPMNWLRAECEAGRLPHLRAGRAILFDPEAVDRVLAERARCEGVRDA